MQTIFFEVTVIGSYIPYIGSDGEGGPVKIAKMVNMPDTPVAGRLYRVDGFNLIPEQIVFSPVHNMWHVLCFIEGNTREVLSRADHNGWLTNER